MINSILPFFFFSIVIFFMARFIGWRIKKYCTFPNIEDKESLEKEECRTIPFDKVTSFFTQIVFYTILTLCFFFASFILLVYIGPF